MNSEGSGNSGRSPDKTSKLRKGSGVDGKARGSREEWKWIGSPLTPVKYPQYCGYRYDIVVGWNFPDRTCTHPWPEHCGYSHTHGEPYTSSPPHVAPHVKSG